MCECGCVLNWDKYVFPAPKKGLYLLSLCGACTNCDAPSGISIELISPGHSLYKDYKKGLYNTSELEFEQWPDNPGVAIITGMRRGDFIKQLRSNLVGCYGNEAGRIDEFTAEEILEQMYEDAQVQPHL